MAVSQRIPGFLAYLLLPVGWLYVLVFQRRNPWAVFHCKQAIALVGWLLAISIGWAIIGWVLAWIPYAFIFSVALFTLVIAAYIFGGILWIVGMINALRGRARPLPIVGAWARRLSF